MLNKHKYKAQLSSIDTIVFFSIASIIIAVLLLLVNYSRIELAHRLQKLKTSSVANAIESAVFSEFNDGGELAILDGDTRICPAALSSLSKKDYFALKEMYAVPPNGNFSISIYSLSNFSRLFYFGGKCLKSGYDVIRFRRLCSLNGTPVIVFVDVCVSPI
jgi:hypothetical protein